MRRFVARLGLISFVLLGACATAGSNEAGPGAPAVVDERQRAAEERRAKEAVQRELIVNANLVAMPEVARSRIRGGAYGEIAQLRFEGGDLDGALEAADLALEAARSADDENMTAAFVRAKYLIMRFSALEAAKAGDLDASMRIFDRISVLPGLSAAERGQAAGDRLLILEMRGDAQDRERDRALQEALGRILGPEERPELAEDKPSVPAGQTFDTEQIRMALSREIGREVAQAQLPTSSELPQMETGRMDHAVVLRVVSANKRSISSCYSASLRTGNGTRGKLELLLTVLPSGAVSNVRIQTAQHQGTALGRCIADKVSRWRFPPFEGEARDVELPFVLDYFQ